jgi:flagellar biosynthesis/type III secretory pathway M-ring protein FliF/YscJ
LASKLERLSVAVVVDNRVSTDSETGEQTSVPLEQEQLDRLQNLVKDAVGFDEERGDSVNIMNSSFIIKNTYLAATLGNESCQASYGCGVRIITGIWYSQTCNAQPHRFRS